MGESVLAVDWELRIAMHKCSKACWCDMDTDGGKASDHWLILWTFQNAKAETLLGALPMLSARCHL